MKEKKINKVKKNPRIFHGPENICGIGGHLADWQRANKGAKSDCIVYTDDPYCPNSHINLHLKEKKPLQSLIIKIKLLFKSLNNYDIYHFYFAKSFFLFNLDLPILKMFKKIIIMHYVGSDIRLHKVQNRINPYFNLGIQKRNNELCDLIKIIRMAWQSIWFDYCIVGKDLLIHAKKAIPERKIIHDIWVGKAISVTDRYIKKSRAEPVIVHAPSNFIVKGTKYVRSAIKTLSAKGYSFTFHIFHKKPHRELMEYLKNDVDIVIDQLLNGAFGIIALEAMSYGIPVCCFIIDDLANKIPDLPIVQCNINDLEKKLAELIVDSKKRNQIGEESWKFAKKYFDKEVIYEKLWQIYIDLWEKPSLKKNRCIEEL